ncbi:MAG TPA: sigma-70 family RNA polymerase sigma factor [Planctomycetota bacterium]|nr:sigma-70 family RNA polymerase sigma factor [Planctomycetota bacterium]
MFPGTVWTNIRRAGEDDREALERFASEYRPPVLRFLRRRGFPAADAEDLCQEVFLRLIRGKVLSRAEPSRGRFRNLLLTVATRVVQDNARRRRATVPLEEEPAGAAESDFDGEWALELLERAFAHLRKEESPYYEVLRGHLEGRAQDRNRLWIARGKLLARIRHEVALTCESPEQVEEEMAHLGPYLRPRAGGEKGSDAPGPAAKKKA